MTGSNYRKISALNDEIDLKLFLYIAKKNFLFLVVFITIAISGSYLYLRYTPPIYQASSIIQLSSDVDHKSILPSSNLYDDDIAKKIEILRSSVFLQRALSKLPLDVSYYNKGKFLNYELYKSTPFSVNTKIKSSSIYGTSIFLDFTDDRSAVLSYTINGDTQRKKEISIGVWEELPELELRIDINNFASIKDHQSLFSKNSHFFIINNPDNIVTTYMQNIKISMYNAAAKTIRILFEGKNAQKTSDIVNIIAEEFSIYDLEKKAESANNILTFIDKQLDLVFDKLTESELELEVFRKRYDITENPTLGLSPLQDRIHEFQNQLIALEMELSIYSDIESTLLENDEIDIYKLIAILAGIDFKSNISNLLKTLHDLLLEREKLLYEVTPSSSQVSALNYQIEIQKKYLVESISAIKSSLESRKSDIEKKLEGYSRLISNQPGRYNILEYTRLQRIYSINEKFYNQLVEKKAEYSISLAGFVPQSTILERSRTPGAPISPKPRSIYISSFLAALLLGVGIIFLRYLFYNEIPSLNDIIKHTDTPILGVIPRYKSAVPQNQLLVLNKPKSIIAEALRSIRTNLQFIDNSPGSKVVAVTSTISSEGKTFFAMNLAGILAFSSKKVVVIDLDMRKPKIHRGFGVENKHGVSTILSGIDTIENCIRASKVKFLDFITAGPVPPNPSELILNKRMDDMIAELKTKYDFIIVDNPPVGIVTDGMKSVMMADYPIYVFKANYSKRIFIQNVNRLVAENKIPNLSIVLNSVDKQYSSYGYDKGYAYGYYGDYGYDYYEENKNGSLSPFRKVFSVLQFKLKKKK
jgi:tyrosine-protein kinase Etk/Wzc